jgi:signal transduction histidine kinase
MRGQRLLAHGGTALTWSSAVAAVVLHAANHGNGGDLTSWWLSNLVTAVLLATPGWLIAARRPGNVVGLLLVCAGLAQSVTALGREYAVLGLATRPGSAPAPVVALSVAEPMWLLSAAAVLLVVLLFPTGRPLTPRWRWALVGVYLLAATLVTTTVLTPGRLRLRGGIVVTNPLGTDSPLVGVAWTVGSALVLLVAVAACVGVVLRFRRARGDERLQMKWFVAAGVATVAESAAELVLPDEVSRVLSPLAVGLFSAAIAVAVLRYRLYDIDRVINRTLVYAALTGCLVGGYLFVVTILGSELGRRVPIGVSMFAAALVAVALVPLRDRLQAGVNRLMYGERADPYGVLARLTGRLGGSATPQETLPLLCRTVGEELRLPYVAVVTGDLGDERVLASYGEPVAGAVSFPMTYQADRIGSLVVAPRAGDELRHSVDRRLLADVATHAGVAVYAARVTDDLRLSRQQVIEAREEERRRLRRDLHDGLGPTLAAMRMGADTAQALLRRDLDAAEVTLAAVRTDAAAAVADVRRLVYGLRPPALDELGLVPALREQAARFEGSGCTIRVEAPEPLPELTAAVEVATYRIVTEALTNVVRHSQARSCVVTLAVNGMLEVSVCDDGTGIADPVTSGVGLASMRERVGELGGRWRVERLDPHGTRVAVAMPTGALS